MSGSPTIYARHLAMLSLNALHPLVTGRLHLARGCALLSKAVSYKSTNVSRWDTFSWYPPLLVVSVTLPPTLEHESKKSPWSAMLFLRKCATHVLCAHLIWSIRLKECFWNCTELLISPVVHHGVD